MSNLFKIVHWKYSPDMAAKDGYGIVVDPKSMGCAWNSLIIGFMNWHSYDQEYAEYTSYEQLNKQPHWIDGWHYEENPSRDILEGIKYSVFLRHKNGMMDNLSLIEILDKLNEYEKKLVCK